MARTRPVIICLAVSLLFHLSMVSVFSIVIRFPSRYVHYASLEIVEAAPSFRIADRLNSNRLVLQVPETTAEKKTEFERGNPFDETYEDTWATDLPIDLPRLEFSELERREQSLRIRTELTEDPKLPEQDSWAAFSTSLRGLGSLIAGLTDREPEKPAAGPARVATPAPGFAAYLEWIAEPKERAVLFAPPVQSLWTLEPDALRVPLEFAFKVDALGKVEEIQILVNDDNGIAADIANTILKYRFEPIQSGQSQVQRGTLVIKAEPLND